MNSSMNVITVWIQQVSGCQILINQRPVTSISGDSQTTLRHIELLHLCVQLKLGLGYRLEEDKVVVHSNGLYMKWFDVNVNKKLYRSLYCMWVSDIQSLPLPGNKKGRERQALISPAQ